MADVVVVGAGVIGAACAEALTARGADVTVIDRGDPAAGTTASGEGNVLVSDKGPGPELDLALASRRRWPELLADLAGELGAELAGIEWEAKGGLVVATTPGGAAALTGFAAGQRAAGVDARPLTAGEAAELEPHLTKDFALAMHYPQDAQVQPVLAATTLLAAVRRRCARWCGTRCTTVTTSARSAATTPRCRPPPWSSPPRPAPYSSAPAASGS